MRSQFSRAVGIGLVAILALLAGCESNEQKLQRLQQEEGVACLRAGNDTTSDSAAALKRRCELARRDLNAFMQGK